MKNSKFFVRIIIDHVNFRTFLTIKALNRKKTRWWKRLSNFNLKIKHKFDKKNSANESSRRQNYEKQITIENRQKIDKFLKIFIFSKTKNFEILNIWNWILMNLKNLFFDDFYCQNQSLKQIQKKKFAIVISLAIEKLIDEKSKSSQFSKIYISKKIMSNASKFFVTKNLQFEFSTNSKIEKFLITTKKILTKRDENFFSRSEF